MVLWMFELVNSRPYKKKAGILYLLLNSFLYGVIYYTSVSIIPMHVIYLKNAYYSVIVINKVILTFSIHMSKTPSFHLIHN